MGNVNEPSYGYGHEQRPPFIKRDESFGSKSPHRTNRISGTTATTNGAQNGMSKMMMNGDGLPNGTAAGQRHQHRYSQLSQLSQRSHSLEHSGGTHSPSSSRSSSSNTNSYLNSILLNNDCPNGSAAGGSTGSPAGERRICLRQSTEPMFTISGDLNPHQIGLVKRAWKQTLKAVDNDETEIAIRLLLRIFELDPRNLAHFSLNNLSPFPMNKLAIRNSPIFMGHIKAFEHTLVHVMTHLTNATTLSKHLQQLGGRYVNFTGVTYKCAYWKCFTQSLIDVLLILATQQRVNDINGIVVGSGHEDLHDALSTLGDFCVEQMRIGYRIEYKLQCEAERLAQSAQQKRRRRDLSAQHHQNHQKGGMESR